MQAQQINCLSAKVLIVLSLVAVLAVVSGYLQPLAADEGAAAHIFQLSIVALLPVILLFFATADWRKPRRNVRSLAIPGALLIFAFAALYYLEHYR